MDANTLQRVFLGSKQITLLVPRVGENACLHVTWRSGTTSDFLIGPLKALDVDRIAVTMLELASVFDANFKIDVVDEIPVAKLNVSKLGIDPDSRLG